MKKFFKSFNAKKTLAILLVLASLVLVACGNEEVSSNSEGSLSSELISAEIIPGLTSSSVSEEGSDEASADESAQESAGESSEEVSLETSEEASEAISEIVSAEISEEASEAVSEKPSEAPSEEPSQAPAQGVGDKNSVADLNKIPEYNGQDYIVIANNIPFFTAQQLTTKGYEKYGELDSLGRCTSAIASLGKDTMPTGDRGSISSVKPTGWIQAKYDCIKTKDLYNRSHLIAWSLSGEDANKQNLVTGTAHLNQDVMTQFEDMVLDKIKEKGIHVAYRVTPLFKGNELVCRGIQMEAYSVEDSGKSICFNVFCYNVQPGVIINYATGESHAEGEDGTSSEDEKLDVVADYVLNTSSKKIHAPDCGSVSTMSEKNKKLYNGTLEDLFAQGYKACGTCNAGQ